MKILQFFLCFSSLLSISIIAHQPNPPNWPPSSTSTGGVFVFDPSDDPVKIQTIVDEIFKINGGQVDNGQFSPNRYALLFKPGSYPGLTVPVGYYTSVIGLGRNPSDTSIFEVVCQEGNFYFSTGALNTFWRSAENFTMEPTKSYWDTGPICMLWAASQATPLRKVQLTGSNGNLCLFQYAPPFKGAGSSSGGFLADSQISGMIISGTQQQWLTRNTKMQSWEGALWNMVFLGCKGAPASHCGLPTPYTTIKETPVIAEKPYITVNKKGKYFLVIPGIEYDKVGSSQDQDNLPKPRIIDFKKVYVASPADCADKISSMICQGYHIILTPGIYRLDSTIHIDRDDICVLGIGFPTLVADNGRPCINVGTVDGVRIAGILLQAGPKATDTLLTWGKKGAHPISGFLYDCFARVGGPNNSRVEQVQVHTMVKIESDNVVCDNLWLWRADHDVGGIVIDGDNPCQTAFEVNGNNVTVYGLAAEHTLKDIVKWNGNKGRVYFYESEYPYDVTQENYGDKGYASYRVHQDVTSHQAWGIGIYSFFRDHLVVVNSGIITPKGKNIHFVNSLTRWLNGFGGIQHVINNLGDAVDSNNPGPAYYCEF